MVFGEKVSGNKKKEKIMRDGGVFWEELAIFLIKAATFKCESTDKKV